MANKHQNASTKTAPPQGGDSTSVLGKSVTVHRTRAGVNGVAPDLEAPSIPPTKDPSSATALNVGLNERGSGRG